MLSRSNGEGAAEALEALRRVSGDDHPRYLRNCADLAWLQSRKDDLQNCLDQLNASDDTQVLTMLAEHYVLRGDFDAAGEYLLKAMEANDVFHIPPVLIRMPEQAPESEPWQLFWSDPRNQELARLRRENGFDPEFKVTE